MAQYQRLCADTDMDCLLLWDAPRTGGVADKTDAVICGIAGFLCAVVIAKKTIEFLKTHKGNKSWKN